MTNAKTFHLQLPADLVAAVEARRAAETQVDSERVSLVRVIRRLIRAGLAAEVACASSMAPSSR